MATAAYHMVSYSVLTYSNKFLQRDSLCTTWRDAIIFLSSLLQNKASKSFLTTFTWRSFRNLILLWSRFASSSGTYKPAFSPFTWKVHWKAMPESPELEEDHPRLPGAPNNFLRSEILAIRVENIQWLRKGWLRLCPAPAHHKKGGELCHSEHKSARSNANKEARFYQTAGWKLVNCMQLAHCWQSKPTH